MIHSPCRWSIVVKIVRHSSNGRPQVIRRQPLVGWLSSTGRQSPSRPSKATATGDLLAGQSLTTRTDRRGWPLVVSGVHSRDAAAASLCTPAPSSAVRRSAGRSHSRRDGGRHWRPLSKFSVPAFTGDMEIQSLSFLQFCILLGDSVVDRSNPGCAWYASTDRRVAARLFLDPHSERFRFSTYRFFHGTWVQRDSRGDEFLAEAELALFEGLKIIAPNVKSVSDSTRQDCH